MTVKWIGILAIIGLFWSCQQMEAPEEICPSSVYVEVDTIDNLYLFYPKFNRIDFETVSYPDWKDTTIIFCCAASFTKERTFSVTEEHVAGPFVSNGVMYEGYPCPDCNGAFVYSNNIWEFVTDSIREKMQATALQGGIGFTQIMIIPDVQLTDRTVRQTLFRAGNYNLYKDRDGHLSFRKMKYQYRALCQLNGKLCILELRKPDTFQSFKNLLMKIKVEKAIYMDVGMGWSYAWYRMDSHQIVSIHPKLHPFISNWLVFRK